MEQFNLDIWIQNKNREIVTRNGKPVRIVCWDSPNKAFPIVGFVDNEPEIFVWDCFGYCREGHIATEYDIFFAADKLNSIIDELKSYLERTPKEQVEKDWKEIQDWYVQHFTNEKHDEEEELTEFEKAVEKTIPYKIPIDMLKSTSQQLLDLAKKEIKGILTTNAYNQGREDTLKGLPKWKKGTPPSATTLYLIRKGYYMTIKEVDELFEILPKEE